MCVIKPPQQKRRLNVTAMYIFCLFVCRLSHATKSVTPQPCHQECHRCFLPTKTPPWHLRLGGTHLWYICCIGSDYVGHKKTACITVFKNWGTLYLSWKQQNDCIELSLHCSTKGNTESTVSFAEVHCIT